MAAEKLARYPELDILGSAMTVDDAYRLIAQTRPDRPNGKMKRLGIGDAYYNTLIKWLPINKHV